MTEIRESIQYYSSMAGGRKAYSVGTGYINIPNSVDDTISCFVNPADSGKDIYLDVGEFGADRNCRFLRFSAPTTSITGLSAARVPNNLSGGLVASVAAMYNRGTFTVSVPGAEAKVAFMSAFNTYFAFLHGDQDGLSIGPLTTLPR